MNVLCICNQNQNRSKTAAKIFKKMFSTKSAGLYNSRSVTEKQLSWADTIVVMEDIQRDELANRFPKMYMQKKILSMNIPDVYRFDQPELITLLNSRIKDLF